MAESLTDAKKETLDIYARDIFNAIKNEDEFSMIQSLVACNNQFIYVGDKQYGMVSGVWSNVINFHMPDNYDTSITDYIYDSILNRWQTGQEKNTFKFATKTQGIYTFESEKKCITFLDGEKKIELTMDKNNVVEFLCFLYVPFEKIVVMLSFLALLDKRKMVYYNILSKIDNDENIGCLTNKNVLICSINFLTYWCVQ